MSKPVPNLQPITMPDYINRLHKIYAGPTYAIFLWRLNIPILEAERFMKYYEEQSRALINGEARTKNLGDPFEFVGDKDD